MSVRNPETLSPRPVTAKSSPIRALLFFDAMITPKIITFVYWLMLLAVAVAGLISMFAVRGAGGFLAGIAAIFGGALIARIWCELLIVQFKINEHPRRVAERS